jgi:hypothetical protein
MWNFLLGFLFARATGISRFIRPLLLLVLLGAVLAGVIYAFAVFQAVSQRSHTSDVHTHSAH